MSNNPLCRLMATFRPQAEADGHVINIDGADEFDATEQLLRMPVERIRDFVEHDYDSDDLADCLTVRLTHSGPFEVDCPGIDSFFEAHGLSRQSLTVEQLEVLRAAYGIGEEQADPLAALQWGEFLESQVPPRPYSLIYVRTGTITVAGPWPNEEEAYEGAKGLQARGDFDIREQEVVLIDHEHNIREICIADLDLDDNGRPRSIPENQPAV